MITTTSFNKTVILKLLHSMSEAQKDGAAYVYNRKGKAYLAIRRVVVDGRIMFQVSDKKGQNIKNTLFGAIFSLVGKRAITAKVALLFTKRLCCAPVVR